MRLSHLREVLVADHPAYRARSQFGGFQGLGSMHPSLRASDADREQLVDVLKNAFTEGRLSQDEYNDRMELAYTAKTYGELRALVGDLPAQVPPHFTAHRPPQTNSLGSSWAGPRSPCSRCWSWYSCSRPRPLPRAAAPPACTSTARSATCS